MASITQEVAAEIAGVTTRHLRRITKEPNGPQQNPDGSYPAADFGKWLSRRAVAGLGVANDGTVYDFNAERARLTHHQANVEGLKEQQLRGDLIPRELVATYWQSIVASVRARLLALPGKIAHVALAAKTLSEVDKAARVQVYEALAELGSDGIPNSSALATPGCDSGMESSASDDGERVGGQSPPPKPRGKRRARSVAH